MKKVYEFLATGFEEVEALAPIDIFRRGGVDAKTVSITGNKQVTGAHGVTVTADLTLEEADCSDADLLALSPEDRSHEGLFLSFQYPVEIPGVSMVNFMRAAVNAKRRYQGLEPLGAADFLKLMRQKRSVVELDNKLASRSVNEGFSGGEKKRNEIFQMAVLEPRLSILDETDSGLDIDALRIVASGVNRLRTDRNATIVITHYQRLLDYIKPDVVHILYKGRIVYTGGPELALELEQRGYDWIKEQVDEVQ